MGFDTFLLKHTLERFVEDLAEESKDLIVERPRYAYAVVVVADATQGEICQASCLRQLDVDVQEAVVVKDDYFDEEIQRALRRLEESSTLLQNEQSDQRNNNNGGSSEDSPMSPTATAPLLTDIERSRTVLKHSQIRFPSMERTTTA